MHKTLTQRAGAFIRLGPGASVDAASLHPGEPLWKRVPTRGDDGRPLSDFMMLIPRLRDKPREEFLRTVERIQGVFEHYQHAVVFADLNTRLNLLWVSVRPVPGICMELPCAIKVAVPEALLVADNSRVPRRR